MPCCGAPDGPSSYALVQTSVVDNLKIYHIWSPVAVIGHGYAQQKGSARVCHGTQDLHRLRTGAAPATALIGADFTFAHRVIRVFPTSSLTPVSTEGERQMITDAKSESASLFGRPWIQLVIGIICMAASRICSTAGRCSSIPSMPSTTGDGRHPGGVHHLRADRNLAGTGRGLPGGSLRAALGGDRAAASWWQSRGS